MKYASRWSENFRVPRRMMEWLERRLAGEKFRLQAITVAGLVMRVWAAPGNIGKPIYLSRDDVARRFGFKDWETRKAIELLVAIGFIHRCGGGSEPRRVGIKPDGKPDIRRPPIIYSLSARILGYFRQLLFRRPPVSNSSSEELNGTLTGEVARQRPVPGLPAGGRLTRDEPWRRSSPGGADR